MSIKSNDTDDFPVPHIGTRKQLPHTVPSLLLAGVVMFLLLLSGCKDNPNNSDPDDGDVDTEELNTEDSVLDSGEVGLVIDTRALAQKGYAPVEADVTFNSPGFLTSWSQTVEIDENTNVATLSIPADTLTEDQISQLGDVQATIEVSGGYAAWTSETTGSAFSLATFDGTVQLNASNRPLSIDDPGLATKHPNLEIIEDTPYLLQALADTPNDSVNMMSIDILPGIEENADAIVLKSHSQSPSEEYKFYFEHVSGSTYYIKIKPKQAESYYMKMSDNDYLYTFYTDVQPQPGWSDIDTYRFDVTRDSNGLMKITPLSGDNPLKVVPEGGVIQYPQIKVSSSANDYTPFRLLPAGIEWNAQDQGTEYNPPITPPVKLAFAYEAILTNCSSAALTHEVGETESQTTTYSTSTSESLELYASHEASMDVTASAGANIGGVDASLEVSAGYTYTTSSTNTTTNTWEESEKETKGVSSNRKVELEPYSAVKVQDAIRIVENVQMPFVQKLRIRGSLDGTSLTGQEVASSLIGQFDGVIVAVGADYVDLSIRGTAAINNMFKAESLVEEIKGACE